MGSTSGIFVTGTIILGLYNLFYIVMFPTEVWTMTIGVVIGFIGTILAVGVISGINILGSGLNSSSIKILFGSASLLNFMFQINIGGFPIGLGFGNNLLNSFGTDSFLEAIAFILSLIFILVILISGLLTITGGSD